MANPLADALVRRVASVGDAKARVGLVRTLLAEIPPEVVAEAAAEIARRAGLRDTAAQLTLLALAAAQEQARPPVPAAEEAITSPEHAPDWGTGRPLTLGERKSLARRPDRRLLERALRDAHPDVIAELLQNPLLTEPDVARLCAAPDARPEVLTRVFANPRWATRPRVRRALASNPRAPVDLALALVPLLARDELREIAADARIANAVRARALEILRRLPPTPEGSGELH